MNPRRVLELAHRAVVEAGLGARNWSGGGSLVLAIYEEGDSYVGIVEIDPAGPTIRQGSRWDRRDVSLFNAIQGHFRRLTRA